MERYQNSINWLKKAQSLIPTGSQTFSKSHYSLPEGSAPLFLESGQGSYVTDIDGNRYIDLVNGLLCVSLGYQDTDVDRAIAEQLKNGISFSLPHKLEFDVAEQLVELIPSAEMVRFGKNGTDVTSAAIRIARAYTQKDHILVCGYHGWQDWFIGSTSRNLGVPSAVCDLTHAFQYNQIDSLKDAFAKADGKVAAVIMEPMNVAYPNNEFLQHVRDFCTQNGIVLIFDEMITGFRFDLKGAQHLFNVTPDLSTFGKGMANGMPLSAIVGNRELMALMDKIFFSGTFGGETLSLAAAKAVLSKMQSVDVVGHLAKVGGDMANGIEKVTRDLKIDWFSLVGHPSWKLYNLSNLSIEDSLLYKTVLIEQLAQAGVLTIGSHNVSYATNSEHVNLVLEAYHESLSKIQQFHEKGTVRSLLMGKELKPVFKVR